MEQYELGTAAAWERIVALQREATQARLAKSRRPAAASPDRGGTTMLTEHQHKPGEFDPGHCQDCARETDLLDHYHHVQRQEQAFKEAHRWARKARRDATWALWSAAIGILLAAIALLTG
jgi:hypothetical protein